MKSEHLPQVDLKSEGNAFSFSNGIKWLYFLLSELFDLTAHVQDDAPEEFAQKLGKTANATQALVTKFVQLGDDNKSDLLQSERYMECQKAQNEVSFFEHFYTPADHQHNSSVRCYDLS